MQRLSTLILLTLIIISALSLNACSRQALPAPDDDAAFFDYLDQVVPDRLHAYQVPGAAIALVRRGQVVWWHGYGLADIQRHTPVTADTIFQVGSLSKSVTAWGVMKLVEQGKFDLDAPVERYLKRWWLPPSGYDHNQVTIRRLLTHTAGLSITPYTGLPAGTAAPTLPEFFELAGLRGRPVFVQFEPGSAFRYSDNDYHLLQMAIEDQTGEPFAEFMRAEVLLPLGMKDSTFEWSPEVQKRTTLGYNSLFDSLDEYVYTQQAAAGLYTTAEDMGRYAAAIIPGPNGEPIGRGVLRPETVAKMLEPQVKVQGFEGMLFRGNYGYGYFMESLPDGLVTVSHPGGNPGWIAEMITIPATGDGLVVLTNVAHGYVLFAALVSAWAKWLEIEPPHLARLILGSHVFFDISTALLGVLSLAVLINFYVSFFRRERRWNLSQAARPLWRGGLLVILPGAALAVWWLVFYERYMISIPRQRDALGLGLTLLCMGILAYGLTRKG